MTHFLVLHEHTFRAQQVLELCCPPVITSKLFFKICKANKKMCYRKVNHFESTFAPKLKILQRYENFLYLLCATLFVCTKGLIQNLSFQPKIHSLG